MIWPRLILSTAVLLLSGCLLPRRGDDESRLTELSHDDVRLKTAFNEGSDRLRILTVLSPTCGSCSVGLISLREQLTEVGPDGALQIHVVWIPILPLDDLDIARSRAAELDDPRVLHYWDQDRTVGRAVAEQLDLPGVPYAFDVYLVYETGRWWTDEPPRPYEWAHQMSAGSDARRHAGSALTTFLSEALRSLSGAGG